MFWNCSINCDGDGPSGKTAAASYSGRCKRGAAPGPAQLDLEEG